MSHNQSKELDRELRPHRHGTEFETGIADRQAAFRRSREIVRGNVAKRLPSLLKPAEVAYTGAAQAVPESVVPVYSAETQPEANRNLQPSAAAVLHVAAPGIGQMVPQQRTAADAGATYPLAEAARSYDAGHTILDDPIVPIQDDWMNSLERTPSEQSSDNYVTDDQARASVNAAFASQSGGNA